jgi:hypothetical protein
MKKTKPAETSLTPYFDEREKRINADHTWCETDEAVRKKYGGKIVAVYNRKIFGAGKHHGEAWDAAQRKRGCPPRNQLAMVYVPFFIPASPADGD